MSRAYSLSLSFAALLASLAAVHGDETKTPRTDLYGDPLPLGAVARLGTIRLRHRGADMVFSKDGKQMISCGSDGEVRVWDAATGKLRRRTRLAWKAQQRPFWMTLSPNGATVAAWSDGAVHLYDTNTGRERGRLPGSPFGSPFLVTFSPDSKRLVVQYWDSRKQVVPQVWDVAAVKKCCVLGGSSAVASSFGEETTAQQLVWDLATGERLRKAPYPVEERIVEVEGSGEELTLTAHAAFAPDGEILTAWRGDRVRLEEVANGMLRAALPQGVGAPLVFSPDGRLVAATILQRSKHGVERDRRKGLSLLETATGEEVVRLEMGAFKFLCFTADGCGLITANKKTLQIWDTAAGQQAYEMAWPKSIHDADDSATICSLAALPGGRVATGMREGDILIWHLAVSNGAGRKPLPDFSREDLEACWSDLAGDAGKAHRAIHRLAAAPTPTVGYLGERLKPAVLDGKRIEKWLADLDSDAFTTREAASRELSHLHYRVEPMLRRALQPNPSLEVRRRVQAILAEPKRFPSEALRTLRAIAILEGIGTPQARRILEKLANGAASPETRAAQLALVRLK